MQAWPTSSACRRGLPCAAVALQLKKIIFDFSLHRFAASRYVSQRVAVREDGVPMIAVAANADCTQRHHHFLCWHLLKSSPKCVPNPHSPAMAAKIRVCRWTSWGGGVCTNKNFPRLHPIDACRAYLHFRHFSHCRTQCDAQRLLPLLPLLPLLKHALARCLYWSTLWRAAFMEARSNTLP